MAKSIYGYPTTRALIGALETTPSLRRICGFGKVSDIPSETTFSRAFAEFDESRFDERVHDALVKASLESDLVDHISRDPTAIEGREKPVKKSPNQKAGTHKRVSSQGRTVGTQGSKTIGASGSSIGGTGVMAIAKNNVLLDRRFFSRLHREYTLPTLCLVSRTCPMRRIAHWQSWILLLGLAVCLRSHVRMMAIKALLLGVSHDQVAKLYDTTRRNLSRWIDRFNTSGIDGLIQRPRAGSSEKDHS